MRLITHLSCMLLAASSNGAPSMSLIANKRYFGCFLARTK